MDTMHPWITVLSFRRRGFVDYPSVEDVKDVFDNAEDITMDGNVLLINFAHLREGQFSNVSIHICIH